MSGGEVVASNYPVELTGSDLEITIYELNYFLSDKTLIPPLNVHQNLSKRLDHSRLMYPYIKYCFSNTIIFISLDVCYNSNSFLKVKILYI